MAETLQHRRVLVLGLGKTGYSLVRYLLRRGALVSVADTRAAPPYAEQLRREYPQVALHCGPLQQSLFDDITLIAISPGLAKDQPLIDDARAAGVSVVGDIELFAQALPARQKVLGITGANGKTTTTELTRALCEAAGLTAVAAGNIGEPVLDVLELFEGGAQFPDVFVLELSSFQLETTDSLKLTAATVLNISENHLDRYRDLDAYAAAKARIFTHAKLQVLNADDSAVCAMRQPNKAVAYFGIEDGMAQKVSALFKWTLGEHEGKPWLKCNGEPLVAAGELMLNGRHNALNALAALALTAAVIDDFEENGLPEAVLPTLCNFSGLPHRMQYVGTVDGVRYINDSKATTVVATQAALAGLSEPVLLILGGDGKKQNFAALAQTAAKAACRAILLIGRDAPIIAAALREQQVQNVYDCGTLAQAMVQARKVAQKGDVVLLSPACASLDQFKDYMQRGEQFAQTVAAWLNSEDEV